MTTTVTMTFHPPEDVSAIRFQWVDESNTRCCCYETHRVPQRIIESARAWLRYASEAIATPRLSSD